MKVIPSHIWDRNQKRRKGEPQVFDLLSQVNIDQHGIAMHSQNLSGGVKQAWSEIDFLIFSTRAAVGIEVKAGRVSSSDGRWHVHKENGEIQYSKNKSPLVQVSDALESFRTGWFKKTFNNRFKGLPFVKVCILCSNARPDFAHGASPPDLPHEFTFYEEDLEPEKLKGLLSAAIDFHIKNYHPFKQPRLLTPEEIQEICETVRPNLDLSYPSTAASQHLIDQQNRLTVEQYSVADMLGQSNRLLIDGGAGTGKTFLLIYGARQEASHGGEGSEKRKIAVVTKPTKLRRFISEELGDTATVIDGNKLDEMGERELFDVLLIDEGQDLCNEESLDSLDRILKGGLQDGRWRWFGDFENQFDNRSSFDDECFFLLKEYTGNNSVIPLNHNVRNTPNVVRWLETICHARVGKTKVRGAGPEVARLKQDEFESLLCTEEFEMRFGDLGPTDKALLYTSRGCIETLPCIEKLTLEGCNISKIEDFKGMEAMAIFICGLDEVADLERLRDLVYRSVSRARNMCFILDMGNLGKALRKVKKIKNGQGKTTQ